MGGRLSPLFLEFEMKMKKETFWGWLLITPLTLGLTLWVAFPVGVAVFMSLFKWNMISPAEFIGLGNYYFMFFQDHLFWKSVSVMFYIHIDERSSAAYFGFRDGASAEYKSEGHGNFPHHLLSAVVDSRHGIDGALRSFYITRNLACSI